MDKYSSNNQTNIHKRLTKRFFIAKQFDPNIESKRMPTAQLLDCWDLLDMTCILFSFIITTYKILLIIYWLPKIEYHNVQTCKMALLERL